jgi:hypothetical protein
VSLLEDTANRIRLQANAQIQALREREGEIREVEQIVQWINGNGYPASLRLLLSKDGDIQYWIDLTAAEKRVAELLRLLGKRGISSEQVWHSDPCVYKLNAWEKIVIILKHHEPFLPKNYLTCKERRVAA